MPAVIAAKFSSPKTYTPKHLAEKILTSKSALEGERKQVTVLFADMKGSMELAKKQLNNRVAMMRDMEMGLWLEKAEAELKALS